MCLICSGENESWIDWNKFKYIYHQYYHVQSILFLELYTFLKYIIIFILPPISTICFGKLSLLFQNI